MASISEDENVPVEETGKRRTRSGRKTTATAAPTMTPSRSTRRTRRTAEPDSQQPDIAEQEEDVPAVEPSIDSSTSANNESSSNAAANSSTESIDNLLANLAEDNANSLPSADGGDDDNDENSVPAPNGGSAAEEDTSNGGGGAVPIVDLADSNSADAIATETVVDDDDDDDVAIAEDLPNGGSAGAADSQATCVDAEMVSEDELLLPPPPPTVQPPQPVTVDDAEEVSDEELPGPRMAELPADTEVVSEDELPASNKTTSKRKVDEDYDPGSPTESTEVPEKRARAVAASDLESDDAVSAAPEKEKKAEKKALPELEKYWKAVRDDPADFTGWTYLLQYVDQENDIEAARSAYDAFLGHYPYCYGYWRKYADYEKRKGNKDKCEEVFERGLRAIPLSVDLWIHYLTYEKQQHGDNEEPIRAHFEKAIAECGLEFRSDKLWEAYIKWETDAKRVSRVVSVYDRLLATPTQGYNGHFDSFQEIVSNHPVTTLVSVDEFKRIRAEVREISDAAAIAAAPPPPPKSLNADKSEDMAIDAAEPAAIATGDDNTDDDSAKAAPADSDTEPPAAQELPSAAVEAADDEADDHVRNDDEATAIKDKIIAARRKVHKQTVAAVTARWTFEEGIKRPYFHVKPLERCQLKNWKEYLDFEIGEADRRRVLVLFERCLIACALYDEFWLKLVRYLESQQTAAERTGAEADAIALTAQIRTVFERACLVHHPDKPALHMLWASFEECNDNAERAAQVLGELDAASPNVLQIAYRRINLERRRGDLQRCVALYEEYVAAAVATAAETGKGKSNAASLSIKYARFLHKVRDDWSAAMDVLRAALARDPLNTRVALQLVDLALQRERVDETEVVAVMDAFVGEEGVELEQRVLFAQRKVEFLEDFGESARRLQEAQRVLQQVMSKYNEAKKKSELSPTKKATSTKDTTSHSSGAYAATGGYGQAVGGAAAGSSAASGYYGQQYGSQQQSYSDGYGGYGQQWQQQYGSGGGAAGGAYSGYSQWSGYGSSGYY